MYSRRINIHNNTIASNRGPSGFGVGLKDMDDAIIRDNLFLDNRIGAHLDGSPREVDSIGRFEGNVFGYNDIGINLLPSVRHNEFTRNSFIENEEQVAIAGGGVMADNAWSMSGQGNYWSDYAGYDADGNGLGDIVYRSDRLFENLMTENPALRIFMYSPATNAVDFAAEAFPLVRPQPKLVDDYPQMSPLVPANVPALPQEKQSTAVWGIALLLAASLFTVSWPWLRPKRRLATPLPSLATAIPLETNS
jgi:nitrous oxidase accessory protein